MKKKCIYISIIGRSNVGKSTLFNLLINKKISITSKRKNTTKKYILGINTINNNQYIYIDTPGFNNYKNFKKIFNKINYFLNKNIYLNIKINLIIIIIENKYFFYEKKIIKKINIKKIPILILINKIDKIKNKNIILNFIKKLKNNINNENIIPICIKKKKHIKYLQNIINKYLIKSKHYFKKNIKTIHNIKFIIKEIIKEKILKFIREEIPYNILIKIKKIINLNKKKIIFCNIYTKNKRHINIIVGKNGKNIKNINNLSKKDIEKYYNNKKKIELFIHIKKKNDKLKKNNR